MVLRHDVFCVEQGVPESIERDDADDTALHLAAVTPDGRVVGTCRLLPGATAWHLGRMAVDAAWRGRGIGALLMRAAHADAQAGGGREIVLGAQVPVRGFYERLGYVAEGDEFEVAGIRHQYMRRPLAVGTPGHGGDGG